MHAEDFHTIRASHRVVHDVQRNVHRTYCLLVVNVKCSFYAQEARNDYTHIMSCFYHRSGNKRNIIVRSCHTPEVPRPRQVQQILSFLLTNPFGRSFLTPPLTAKLWKIIRFEKNDERCLNLCVRYEELARKLSGLPYVVFRCGISWHFLRIYGIYRVFHSLRPSFQWVGKQLILNTNKYT